MIDELLVARFEFYMKKFHGIELSDTQREEMIHFLLGFFRIENMLEGMNKAYGEETDPHPL